MLWWRDSPCETKRDRNMKVNKTKRKKKRKRKEKKKEKRKKNCYNNTVSKAFRTIVRVYRIKLDGSARSYLPVRCPSPSPSSLSSAISANISAKHSSENHLLPAQIPTRRTCPDALVYLSDHRLLILYDHRRPSSTASRAAIGSREGAGLIGTSCRTNT